MYNSFLFKCRKTIEQKLKEIKKEDKTFSLNHLFKYNLIQVKQLTTTRIYKSTGLIKL